MTFKTLVRPALCLSAILSGTTALAEVTAAQVWEDWKANFAIYGQDAVTIGSEEMAGGTLTVRDFRIDSAVEEGGRIEGQIDLITLTEQGDGTVAVTMSDTVPVTITSDTPDGTQIVSISARQTGLRMIVRGTPEELVYDISAARYAVTLDDITGPDMPEQADFLIAVNGMNGTYTSRPGPDLRETEYGFTAASVDLLIEVDDEEGALTLSGQIADVATAATVKVPADPTIEPDAIFVAGMDVAGSYTLGAAAYVFDFSDGMQATAGSASAAGSALEFALNGTSTRYSALARNLAVDVTGDSLPVPLSLTLAEYGLDFEMPLADTEAPAPFGLGLNLSELVVSDAVWDMLDMQGSLPRDPLSLIVSLSGTARLFHDLLDPAGAEALAMAETPGEIYGLSLDRLLVSGLGASLTGEGALTFDNEDLETFDGMPRPEGAVNLRVTGANALLDRLAEMGLVPSDQVMGARMMMGLFTTPVGDDELTSKIEINAEGHVIANGQRIQ